MLPKAQKRLRIWVNPSTTKCFFFPQLGRLCHFSRFFFFSKIPDSEIDKYDESVWLSFTNSETKEQLQLAVTPYGQSLVALMKDSVEVSLRDYELSGVFCDSLDDIAVVSSWSCTIYIPWHYLPTKVNQHQVVHRVPLPSEDGKVTVTASHYSCAAFEMLNSEGEEDINFDGCSVNRKLFVEPADNDADSPYWTKAKDGMATAAPPSTDGAGNVLTSVALVAVSVVLAVIAA